MQCWGRELLRYAIKEHHEIITFAVLDTFGMTNATRNGTVLTVLKRLACFYQKFIIFCIAESSGFEVIKKNYAQLS